MIHMPHRSVTRFFIPLIDVLLLLFGIFLLMPIASETQLDEERENVGEQRESVQALQYELRRRTEELQKFENLRPELANVEQLKDEIKRLRDADRTSLQNRADVHVIDVDPKTGGLFYYDATREPPRIDLPDARAVQELIQRQREQAAGRELYYYFLYPRPETGYPTDPQRRRYSEWFAGVANSLKEARP